MQIDISQVIGKLETACNQARGLEVSGYGFVRQEKDSLVVYDACVLDVGSYGETNIDPRKPEVAGKLLDLLERPDARNMKLWWHRHPVQGWSGTDEYACTVTPLGGDPRIVGWSAAVVRTPAGWIGRIDNHLTRKTAHVPVVTGVEDFLADTDLWRSQQPFYRLFDEVNDDLDYEELAEELDDDLEAKEIAFERAAKQSYGWLGWLRRKGGKK